MISGILCVILAQILDVSFNEYVKLTLIYVLINILLAVSLNLINGFTGQFSLGHAGFMAVGAYSSAYIAQNLSFFPSSFRILDFPIYAVLGGLFAAFAGYLVGLPSLRLKGDYLAIVTLGFGEIIRVVLLNMEFLGGARGFSGVADIPGTKWEVFGYVIQLNSFFWTFSIAALFCLVCVFMISRLVRSAHGRGFLSVREDEIAAQAMGVDTTSVKVKAFVLSSFFAGVAGSIFAHTAGYLSPASFSFLRSVDAIIMVVLGGMGSLTGSVVAAFIITLLPEVLRPLQAYTAGVDFRMVIYSLSLILLMIARPTGLFGSRELFSYLPKSWQKKLGA